MRASRLGCCVPIYTYPWVDSNVTNNKTNVSHNNLSSCAFLHIVTCAGDIEHVHIWGRRVCLHCVMDLIDEIIGSTSASQHDDVMTWKRLLHYWPFVGGIHRSPVDSPHKGLVVWSFGVSIGVRWTFKSWGVCDLRRLNTYKSLQFPRPQLVVHAVYP